MELPVDYTKLNRNQKRAVREEYIKQQSGKCWFCDRPLDGNPSRDVIDFDVDLNLFPRGFFNYSIHLQHDHDTGMTEGAVHAKCNAYLWQKHGR